MDSSPPIKEPFVTFDDVYATNKKYNYGGNEDTSCSDLCGCIIVAIGNLFCCCFYN